MGDVSPPASVQVLTNSDLLHDIFSFVPSSAKRDSHLARCATVCRTFHEPVIRVLWRNLDALSPLWHLLAPPSTPFPPDGAADDELLNYLQTVSSARLHLDPMRWDRFLWHTAYVRGIYHSLHPDPAVEEQNRLLMQAVTTQNGGRTVLPLLRRIRWEGGEPPDGILAPFFTSTLRHAGATSLSDEGARLSLRRLRESSPLLESVYIDRLNLPLVQELLHFPRLCAVQIFRMWGSEATKAIITKPNLTQLRIHHVIPPWTDPGRVVSVRDLRVLTVRGHIPTLSALFDAVRFQALETANIQVMGYLQRLFDNVALLGAFYGAVSASRLQNLDLVLLARGSGSPPPDYAFPALRDVLAHILPLSDLRSFNLIATLEFAKVDDVDVEALARAWPKLERLHIDRGSTRASGVSMAALHCLCVGCPNLRELSVPGLHYPTIGVHEIPAPPLDRSLPHPLRHLGVRTLWFPEESPPYISDEEAEALARYLLDLFPRFDGWKYKPVPPHDDSPAPKPSPELSRTLAFEIPSAVSPDGRWGKVARRIYAICSAREGM